MASKSMSAIVSGEDYLALPRSAESWLVEPFLPVGGKMAIYGPPKSGKSYLAMQLAMDITSGTPWLDKFKVPKSGRVVYFQLDTPRSLWAKRLEEYRKLGLCSHEVYQADRETLGVWPLNMLDKQHFDIVQGSVEQVKPDLVIFDTARHLHRGDEDKSGPMEELIAAITAACGQSALIIISHARKPAPDRPMSVINDLRGNSHIAGSMDSIVHLTKTKMSWDGRQLEDGSLRMSLNMLNDWAGLWVLDTDEVLAHVESVLSLPGSRRQKAEALAGRTGRSFDACHSLLRRYEKTHRLRAEE